MCVGGWVVGQKPDDVAGGTLGFDPDNGSGRWMLVGRLIEAERQRMVVEMVLRCRCRRWLRQERSQMVVVVVVVGFINRYNGWVVGEESQSRPWKRLKKTITS